jgi:hypothetical protein
MVISKIWKGQKRNLAINSFGYVVKVLLVVDLVMTAGDDNNSDMQGRN